MRSILGIVRFHCSIIDNINIQGWSGKREAKIEHEMKEIKKIKDSVR